MYIYISVNIYNAIINNYRHIHKKAAQLRESKSWRKNSLVFSLGCLSSIFFDYILMRCFFSLNIEDETGHSHTHIYIRYTLRLMFKFRQVLKLKLRKIC